MENFTPLNPTESIAHPNHFSFKKVIVYCIFGLVLLLGSFYYFFLSAPGDFPADAIANIEEGKNLRNVSFYLKNQHIIRSRLAFEAFAILYGGERHLISTDYFFEDPLPVYEIARRISKGERHLAPVKVTIPEGFTVAEAAQVLSSKLINFNEENFMKEAREGYLFPDTYFFLTTGDEQDVLKATQMNYEKKVAPLRNDFSAFKKTEKEIIVMASIIEKEAKGDADRALISGILWRRLSIGMALQVDAAPITYKERGLPKSPIANPGLEAIKAAIHPQSSPYLYYLHDKDGGVHFARSFAEHINNKNKYLK
ncbi:MAG: endolytic transglycosylase MltG [Candidatus Paceibacterota bacterium]|jgi:UPF0755 protein